MTVPTVGQWLALMDELAPFSLAEPGDNVGLLTGDPAAPAGNVLLALDLTQSVAEEAVEAGARLVITHHPAMYAPVCALRWDDPILRPSLTLLKADIAHIAAHTNFDRAEGGVGDALAETLDLADVERGIYLRVGRLPEMRLADLAIHVQRALGGAPRIFGDSKRIVSRVAACGGGGMDEVQNALAMGAQALITGDVRHHDALDALAAGLAVIDAGHWETERVALKPLMLGLQRRADALKYSFNMEISRRDASPVAVAPCGPGGEGIWI